MAVIASVGFLCLAVSRLLQLIQIWSLPFPHRAYIRTASVLVIASWTLLAGSALVAGWRRWSSAAWVAAAGFLCSAAAQIVIDLRFFPSATEDDFSDVLEAIGWAGLAAAVIVGWWRARPPIT
jgi:hypothetical protein